MSDHPDKVPYGSRMVTPADKRRLVGGHFDEIAPRYDLADAVLSFGLHHHWRKRAIRRLALKRGERVLDLCGGTADLAVLAAGRILPEGTVAVCDVNRAMMRAGRSKVNRSGHRDAIFWVQGDAENLCFRDGAFDAVTVGFGVRNIVHLEPALGEMFRVLGGGGRLMILEFSVPRARWIRRLYEFYSFRIIPVAGKALTGTAEPYRYLTESIRAFPAPAALKSALEAAGFVNVSFRSLTAGVVTAYLCEKRP
jgi:demethylmenaquinone methyltransferase/2-methoxy-6-polyprenyl-1,4-benzoquinol methylase